jgi:hypothetical protein
LKTAHPQSKPLIEAVLLKLERKKSQKNTDAMLQLQASMFL